MTESEGSAADNLEEDDANDVLLDELKRQKKIVKMQLTKLYSRLMTLMSEDVDKEAILLALETVEEKRLDAIQILEDLIIIYAKRGDKKNVDRSNDEIDKIIEATDKEITAVKDFLSFLSRKPSSKEFLQAKSGPYQRDWKLEELEEIIPKKGDEIPAPSPHPGRPFNLSADKKLERIKLPTFNGDKTKFDYFWTDPIVDLLIGQDQIDLHFAKVDVRGKPGEPIARLGPLGWSCVGCPEGNASTKIHRTNLACTFFSRPHIFDELNDSMKRFWEFDTFGVQENGVKVMTREEKIALDKVQVSLVHDGERYQVATPWTPDCPMLPNNYEMAYSRLRNTEKRLIRQASVGEDYKRVIASYVEKGYIRKVPQAEDEPQCLWYLPHFPVCRPERSTTKTRIVFDASAKFQGTSLNDQILPGPKLQTNLFEVLLRFRRFPVAFACDVSEMYLQIRIPPPDRPMFRFLWRNLEVDRSPDVYEFERVVFGDASAPFRAQFVSLENAKVYEKEFPLAAETVRKSTYMDDSLDSTKDNDSAIQLFQELQSLWNKARMKARKWLSNSPEVLSAIPQELRALEIDLQHNALPVTKTLGILWNAQEDVFSFRVTTPETENILTKRFIVGRVAEVFDQLGLASPFIVQAKILIQDLWTMGLGWDDPKWGDLYSSKGMVFGVGGIEGD